MPQFTVEDYLKALPGTNKLRHDAWDAFNNSVSDDDFQKRLNNLGLPNKVKHDLWNLKYNPEGAWYPDPAKDVKPPIADVNKLMANDPQVKYAQEHGVALHGISMMTPPSVLELARGSIGAGGLVESAANVPTKPMSYYLDPRNWHGPEITKEKAIQAGKDISQVAPVPVNPVQIYEDTKAYGWKYGATDVAIGLAQLAGGHKLTEKLPAKYNREMSGTGPQGPVGGMPKPESPLPAQPPTRKVTQSQRIQKQLQKYIGMDVEHEGESHKIVGFDMENVQVILRDSKGNLKSVEPTVLGSAKKPANAEPAPVPGVKPEEQKAVEQAKVALPPVPEQVKPAPPPPPKEAPKPVEAPKPKPRVKPDQPPKAAPVEALSDSKPALSIADYKKPQSLPEAVDVEKVRAAEAKFEQANIARYGRAASDLPTPAERMADGLKESFAREREGKPIQEPILEAPRPETTPTPTETSAVAPAATEAQQSPFLERPYEKRDEAETIARRILGEGNYILKSKTDVAGRTQYSIVRKADLAPQAPKAARSVGQPAKATPTPVVKQPAPAGASAAKAGEPVERAKGPEVSTPQTELLSPEDRVRAFLDARTKIAHALATEHPDLDIKTREAMLQKSTEVLNKLGEKESVEDATKKIISRIQEAKTPKEIEPKTPIENKIAETISQHWGDQDLDTRMAIRKAALEAYQRMSKEGDPDALEKVIRQIKGEDNVHFRPDPQGWISKLADVVREKMKGPMGSEQLRATLLNAGVSPEELKWTDTDRFLAERKKITPAELVQHLESNRVELREIVKGSPSTSGPAFDEMARLQVEHDQLLNEAARRNLLGSLDWVPGDPVARTPDYYHVFNETTGKWDNGKHDWLHPEEQELVRKLEENRRSYYQAAEQDAGRNEGGQAQYESFTLPGGTNYREVLLQLPVEPAIAKGFYGTEAQRAATYNSSHFDEPNIVAHLRLKDRVDANGKKTLFVEEVQSDWHEAGNKYGYIEQSHTRNQERINEIYHKLYYQAENGHIYERPNVPQDERDVLSEEYDRLRTNPNGMRVPPAPFRSNWHELAMKKALRMAAEGGYDQVAWTTGEQQAKRYNLGTHISGANYDQATGTLEYTTRTNTGDSIHVPRERLAEYLGQDAAEQLLKANGKNVDFFGETTLRQTAHHRLYDEMIPQFMSRYGKKWGGRVGETQLTGVGTSMGSGPYNPMVHSMDITPAMRETLMKGQTMFIPGKGNTPYAIEQAIARLPKFIQNFAKSAPERTIDTVTRHTNPVLRDAVGALGSMVAAFPKGKGWGGFFDEKTGVIGIKALGPLSRVIHNVTSGLTMDGALAHEGGHAIYERLDRQGIKADVSRYYPQAAKYITDLYRAIGKPLTDARDMRHEVFAQAFHDWYMGKPGDHLGFENTLRRDPKVWGAVKDLRGAGTTFVPGESKSMLEVAYGAMIGEPNHGLPIGESLKELAIHAKDWLEDQVSPKDVVQMSLRKRYGEADIQLQRYYSALKKDINALDSYGEKEFRTWMDAGEQKPGSTPLTGRDRQVQDWLKTELEVKRDIIHAERPEMFEHFIENYFSRLFERPGLVGKTLRQIMSSKSTLEGRKSYLKQRYYDFATDAMDAGAKPVTYNPIKMQLATLHQMDRFIAAIKTFKDLKSNVTDQGQKAPLISYARSLAKLGPDRADWMPIDDPIFNPAFIDPKTKGFVHTGRYYAPPEVAKTINEYLAPGLRGKWWYDPIRSFGNTLNMANLGLSAYHLTFSAITTGASNFGLGVAKLTKGNLGGAVDIAKAATFPISVIREIQFGSHVRQAMLDPNSYPHLAKLAQAYTDAGGRYGMDVTYKNNAIDAFWRRMKDHEWGKAGLKAFPALIEWSSKPIMEKAVPNIKAAAFARRAEFEMAEAQKSGLGQQETLRRLDRVADTVDNLFGQMVYDNTFWNKATKDLSMLMFRSVGWNAGNFRFAKDALGEAIMKGSGRGKKVIPVEAYTALGLPLIVGTYGAIYGYMTGNPPQELEDYFFPKGPDGSRMNIASYVKDWVGIAHDPVGTVVNKLNPSIALTVQMLQNRDYYGTEIRHKEDPFVNQVGQVLGFGYRSVRPFTFSNMENVIEQGGTWGQATGSFFGITPAPRWIGESKLEQYLFEIDKRHMEQGPHTREEFEARRNYVRYREEFASGKLDAGGLVDLVNSGSLRPHDLDTIVEGQSQTLIERRFKHAKPDEALHAWELATPTERAVLRPSMANKMDAISSEPLEMQPILLKKFQDALAQ